MYAGPGGNRGEFIGLGCRGRRARRLEHQGGLSGLERRRGDRRRRGLLRHDGRLVQSRRREDRRRALAVQDRLRDHRPADRSTAGPDGKEYVADPVRASAAGPARSSPAMLDPRDGTAALGFVNAMKDLPQVTSQGRDALCLRAAVAAPRSSPPSGCSPGGALAPGDVPGVDAGHVAPRLRRPEQPAVLERRRRRASRTASPSCSRTISACRVDYTLVGAAARLRPQHAAAPAIATSSSACRRASS